MTTLNTLSTARPDPDEVADAALAMADFDAKGGDHMSALEWLGVAEAHRALSPEYVGSEPRGGRPWMDWGAAGRASRAALPVAEPGGRL